MNRIAAITLALASLAASEGNARADVQSKGPEVWPGKSEVSVHLGFQSPLSRYTLAGGPPAGLRLLVDYNFRFYDAGPYTVWFNIGPALTIGGDCSPRAGGGFNNNYLCGAFASGDEAELLAGVKLKFKVTPVPLVPYVRFDAYFTGIFNRYCNDFGLGVGARVSGGVKYFLTRHIGVGVETGFSFGPAFYPHGAPDTDPVCFANMLTYRDHTEFYSTFELLVGAEFAFSGM